MRLFAFALLLVLAMATCGKDDPVKPRPVVGDQIVFYSTRSDGILDLYKMNADGGGLTRLTADTLEDWEPRWSPDRSKIAFIHRYGDSSSVTVMSADGTNRIRLTPDYRDAAPSWSPAGDRIAYMRNPGSVATQLWMMNADGSSARLVIDSDTLNGVAQISWTSQNTFLGADGFGLVRFNADGTGRKRIISLFGVGDAYPRLSPDGSMIVFAWDGPAGGGSNIYRVTADGSDLRQLTTIGGPWLPVWSPEGRRIGYVGHDFRIWTMNVDGTDQKPVPMADPYPGSDYIGDWR